MSYRIITQKDRKLEIVHGNRIRVHCTNVMDNTITKSNEDRVLVLIRLYPTLQTQAQMIYF